MINNFLKKEDGSLFAESMIAISLALVGLLGIISLLTVSIRHTNDSHARFVASFLAIEGVEVVKNIIDGYAAAGLSWNNVLSNVSQGTYKVQYDSDGLVLDDGQYLNFNRADGIYHYGAGEETVYRRTVKVEHEESNWGTENTTFIKVTSKVTWRILDRPEMSAEAISTFYEWRHD